MKVLVVSNVDRAALETLRARHAVNVCLNPSTTRLLEEAVGAEVIVLRSGVDLTREVLEAASTLRLVVRAGAGVDNIDVKTAAQRGVHVVRVPGMSAPPVAEMTFALMLALARKVVVADRLLRQGLWPKAELGGPLLLGKTLGIIGAGNIGGLVGRMGAAWGMRVLGCVGHPGTEEEVQRLGSQGIELTHLGAVVENADVLTLHVPLDDATHHLVDAALLARMRPGSLLINMARGGVVDEKALMFALASGESLVGAALDVHEQEGEGTVSPLSHRDDVVLTPHLGGMAVDSQRLIGERVVQLIDAFEADGLEKEVHEGELVR